MYVVSEIVDVMVAIISRRAIVNVLAVGIGHLECESSGILLSKTTVTIAFVVLKLEMRECEPPMMERNPKVRRWQW